MQMMKFKPLFIFLILVTTLPILTTKARAKQRTSVKCYTSFTFASPKNHTHKVTTNKKYVAGILSLVQAQHKLDHWAGNFLNKRGYNYNNVNIVTMFTSIKEKYPQFQKQYVRKEDSISKGLERLITKYGLPYYYILGGFNKNSARSVYWLSIRSVDTSALKYFNKNFLLGCKEKKIPCVAIPFVKDRYLFLTQGLQKYGTLPNVPLLTKVSMLDELNQARKKYQLKPFPKSCVTGIAP